MKNLELVLTADEGEGAVVAGQRRGHVGDLSLGLPAHLHAGHGVGEALEVERAGVVQLDAAQRSS